MLSHRRAVESSSEFGNVHPSLTLSSTLLIPSPMGGSRPHLTYTGVLKSILL